MTFDTTGHLVYGCVHWSMWLSVEALQLDLPAPARIKLSKFEFAKLGDGF